jgi:hypothetical protein
MELFYVILFTCLSSLNSFGGCLIIEVTTGGRVDEGDSPRCFEDDLVEDGGDVEIGACAVKDADVRDVNAGSAELVVTRNSDGDAVPFIFFLLSIGKKFCNYKMYLHCY